MPERSQTLRDLVLDGWDAVDAELIAVEIRALGADPDAPVESVPPDVVDRLEDYLIHVGEDVIWEASLSAAVRIFRRLARMQSIRKRRTT